MPASTLAIAVVAGVVALSVAVLAGCCLWCVAALRHPHERGAALLPHLSSQALADTLKRHRDKGTEAPLGGGDASAGLGDIEVEAGERLGGNWREWGGGLSATHEQDSD